MKISEDNAHPWPAPDWATDSSKRPKGSYFGFFENNCGEQICGFVHNGVVTIAHGDMGWEEYVCKTEITQDHMDHRLALDVFLPEICQLSMGEKLWFAAFLTSAAFCHYRKK